MNVGIVDATESLRIMGGTGYQESGAVTESGHRRHSVRRGSAKRRIITETAAIHDVVIVA